jgi:hypothetical protein
MTLSYERSFGEERRNASVLFGLPDDLALPEVSEELANDAEARQVAQIVANDLSRDRYDGEQVAVLVFNNSGQLIHKVWTWPPAANKTLFPEHAPTWMIEDKTARAATIEKPPLWG